MNNQNLRIDIAEALDIICFAPDGDMIMCRVGDEIWENIQESDAAFGSDRKSAAEEFLKCYPDIIPNFSIDITIDPARKVFKVVSHGLAQLPFPKNFTVVFSEEGEADRKFFLAQCIEYNFCVQGETLEETKSRFEDAIWSHIGIALRCGAVPFECISRVGSILSFFKP